MYEKFGLQNASNQSVLRMIKTVVDFSLQLYLFRELLILWELTKQSERMRTEVSSLQTQNQDLNKDNQRILSSLINSRHTFDFMCGLINSLRNEILGLASISAYITCSVQLEFENIENLKCNNGNEFASLSRACKGEENVSIDEIKKELIKAIEVMQNKLDVNDRLTDVLSSARLAFMDKADA